MNPPFNDESNLKNSSGVPDFDRTHRFVVSYRYALPLFTNPNGWKKTAFGDWSISGITVIQYGAPFSVTDSGAGTTVLAPGYTPTLTGSLAPGATIHGSYSVGDIHNPLTGYLNS